MSATVNYYTLLGVDAQATPAEVSSAASALLKATHPDRTGSSASAHLTDLILQARKTLSDPRSRADYDKDLSSATSTSSSPESTPPANAQTPEIDPLAGGFTAYLISKIMNRMATQHERMVDTGPGTMAVDPMTLLRGAAHGEQGVSWGISPSSRPGDRVDIMSGTDIVDTVTLTLSPPDEGVYYADGLVWCMMYAPAERMMRGGTVQCSAIPDLHIPVPAGSGMYTIIDVDGVTVMLVNDQLKPFMDDADVIDNMVRLLDR